ncbi:MAG: CoA pyrophosphatase [Pseudomonadota bacterium]
MFQLDEITAALRRTSHVPAQFVPDPSHAAVAMILAQPLNDDLQVCFIRRAERDGDPWSGQVAFPGGRASAGDENASAVAERETLEEIGFDLTNAERLGALPIRDINRRGSRNNMTLSPFIYHAAADAPLYTRPRETHEVARVFWVPLGHLFDPINITSLDYELDGSAMTFPGIDFDGEVIWGLTLTVLGTFGELMDRPLPALK